MCSPFTIREPRGRRLDCRVVGARSGLEHLYELIEHCAGHVELADHVNFDANGRVLLKQLASGRVSLDERWRWSDAHSYIDPIRQPVRAGGSKLPESLVDMSSARRLGVAPVQRHADLLHTRLSHVRHPPSLTSRLIGCQSAWMCTPRYDACRVQSRRLGDWGNDHEILGYADPRPDLPLPATCGYEFRGTLVKRLRLGPPSLVVLAVRG